MTRLPPTHIPGQAAAILAGTVGMLQLVFAAAGGVHPEPTMRWAMTFIVAVGAFVILVSTMAGRRLAAGAGVFGFWFAIYLDLPIEWGTFE